MVDTPPSRDEVITDTVLLVDDQAFFGEAVRRIISLETALDFHYCAEAAQALDTAIQVKPTVILQDLIMPGVDGLSVVRSYRANPATADIPIIVLSANDEPKVKSAAFAAGANDYLVKLPDSLELIARIRYHSRSYRTLRERDKATRALQLSQKRLLQTHQELRVLLDTVPTAIVKLDENGRMLQSNHATQSLLGIDAERLLGLVFSDVLVAEARPHFQRRLDEALQSTGTGQGHTEAELLREDGRIVPIEYLITPLPATHGIELSLVMSDITERKEVDRAKSEFISTVSHELRTPLTSIRGALGMFLSGKLGPLTENMMRMLDIANRNSERLTQLINDILDLEKISTGRIEFKLVPIAADVAMEAAINANEGYGLRHDVRLRIMERSNGAWVVADELRLQQVFSNLISNAIKYSSAGGFVDLSAAIVDDFVQFGVRDYGPGIPEEFRSRIFNRFSQANSSDTRSQGGTGLGLSIARNIVEQLDGDIGFDTSLSGTEFYFRLPRIEKKDN